MKSEDKKPKRPRRQSVEERMAGAEEVKDELAFTASLGSKNAREIITVTEHISLELWYEKHYLNRDQHVDDDGNKRDVSPRAVQALVTKSLKHLIFYSSVVKNFTFLNHENSPNIIRAIIKDTYSGDKPLSIACQIHFKNLSKYQFTVITAIDDHIRLGAGQYFIELVDESHSVLKKFENGKYQEVFSCQD